MLQVSLEEDVVLSQANEYEILQLLLGECRDRLTSYEGAPGTHARTEKLYCRHRVASLLPALWLAAHWAAACWKWPSKELIGQGEAHLTRC